MSVLDDAELIPMMDDQDYYVRLVIARRVAPSLLARMIDDEEAEVRRVVAQRIPRDGLLRMASDRTPSSGWRSPSGCAGPAVRLRYDPDWRVRYEVACRVAVGEIGELADDGDGFVRDMARSA